MGTYLNPEPRNPTESQICAVTFELFQDSVYFPAHRDKEVDESGTLTSSDEMQIAEEFVHFLKTNSVISSLVLTIDTKTKDFLVTMECSYEHEIADLKHQLMTTVYEWNRDRRRLEQEVLAWHKVYILNTFNLSDELDNEMI